MNSREKGKRGEREAAELLRRHGFDARRGQQHRGGPDSPDVVVDDLPGLHFEVKRCERLDLYGALAQATRESRPGQTSVVLHRRNGEGWVAILDADRFVHLIAELESLRASLGYRGAA